MTSSFAPTSVRHLSFVAHHDDDLLFLHTDLRKVIDRGGSVRIVYLTASDADGGTAYANDREYGVEIAYWSAVDYAGWKAVSDPFVAQAVNDPSPPPGSTSRSRYADLMRTYLTTHPVWTVLSRDPNNPMKRILALTGNERMSVQYLRLRSSIHYASGTQGRTKLYNLERGLDFNGNPVASSTLGDVDDKLSYSRQQIVDMLRDIILDYRPTMIHCQCPTAVPPVGWPWPFPHGADHPDHIATAKLAREAAIAAGYEAKIVGHVCYPSAFLEPNVGTQEETNNKTTFQVYAKFDYKYGDDAVMTEAAWLSHSGTETDWVKRNHYLQWPAVPGGVVVTNGQPTLFVTGEQTSGVHYMRDEGSTDITWRSLGGRFPGRPVPFRFTDGRLGVVGVSGDSTLYLRAQKLDGNWWDWLSLDGPVESDPSVTALLDGRLAIVFRTRNGALRFVHEESANGSWIGSWRVISPEDPTGIGRPVVALSGTKWLIVSLRSGGSVAALFGTPDELASSNPPAWKVIPGWSVPVDTELALLPLPGGKIRLYGVGVTRAVWFADFDPATQAWSSGVRVKATEDGQGLRFAVAHVTNLGPVFAQILKDRGVRVVIGDRVEYLGGGSSSLLGLAATGSDAVTVYTRTDAPEQQAIYARTLRTQGIIDNWRWLGTLSDSGAGPFSASGVVTRLTTAT